MAKSDNGAIVHWLQVLRSKQLGWAKKAALGGAGNDMPFEQAFSNLAHAYLRDKAPSLLDYEVGFQLLERNQDNTKAVGVMAFKVGPQWIYSPVFFLRGELKGHELLYLKNSDMFVPMKENWLNYILNKKPNVLGDGVDRNLSQIGVVPPDLSQLSSSPSKRASAYPAWVEQVLPAFAYMATTPHTKQKRFADTKDLPQIIKEAGIPAAQFLLKVAKHYPVIFKAAVDFHGSALQDALEYAQTNANYSVLHSNVKSAQSKKSRNGSVLDKKETHPLKTGALQIITFDYTVSTNLPKERDDDQEALMRDGLLIKDRREGDQVSVAYDTNVEKKLSNPAESGLHDMLSKTGDIERCLVVLGPRGPNGRENFSTVVRVGDNKSWINIHPSHVWSAYHANWDEYRKWFDGLSSAGSLTNHATYMVVGPNAAATLPFEVIKSFGDEKYEVRFERHAEKNQPAHLTGVREYSSYKSDRTHGYDSWRDGQRVHLNAKDGSKLRSSGGDVWIPEGFKVIKLKDPPKWRKDMPDREHDGQTDPAPINPGNLVDAELSIMKKTAELTIYNDGLEIELNGKRMQPKQALISLVRDHGFREQQSRELLKRAEQQTKIRCRVNYADYIKQAQDPMLGFGPGAPSIPEPPMGSNEIMGGAVPAQYPQEQTMPVTGMTMGNPTDYDPTNGPDPMAMQTAQQAAQMGQKEIFDTAIIGGMLKAVRQDSMVDKYLSDLMKGMDRVGRIMFMFYWHQDDFADRYGKTDLPELEDSLRNTFESMGDLVLFLKQKSIESPEDVGVDLSDIAGD
jgi:hypothetical protein